MASREISLLHPEMRERAEAWLAKTPVPVLCYCTVREPWEQAQLFAQGRNAEQIASGVARLRALGLDANAKLLESQQPRPGKRVTNAPPGLSLHQPAWLRGKYGALALDFVPVLAGKPLWNDPDRYEQAAMAAESVGLSWAGRWSTFREFPHLQLDDGGKLRAIPLALGEYR